jgi:hypothetical protein
MTGKPKRSGPRQGTNVIWPSGVQDRYDISAPTRWRWERDGKLPARDVFIGGRSGWRPGTLDAAERGPAQSAA